MTAAQAFPCPHCGAVYNLDAAYIAAYGGQHTQCSNCRNTMVVPMATSAAPVAAIPVQPAGVPPYGSFHPGYAYMAPPAPAGAVPLGYAGGHQSYHAHAFTVVRDRDLVVANSLAVFPPYCVKCGSPIQHAPIRRQIRWANPLYYLTFFAGLLVMIIVLMYVSKYCTVRIGLCERHRRRWKTDITVGYCLLGATVAPIPFVVIFHSPWPLVAMPVFLIAGLIMVLGATPILRARRCDGERIWLAGAGEEFLAMLPTQEQAIAARAAQFGYYGYTQNHALSPYPPAGGPIQQP